MSTQRSIPEHLKVHSRTPGIVVCDPRGLGVRTLAYHRRTADTPAERRGHAQWHDALGRPTAQWDPRQLAHFEAGTSDTPNQRTVFSLSGVPLQQHNVDSGWKVMLQDASGLARASWDSRQTCTTHEYDALGRMTSVIKHDAQGPSRTTQRITYAAVDPEQAELNLCGSVIRHDDDAGSLFAQGFSITGEAIRHSRRFLAGDTAADWPEALSARDALLEAGAGYTSHSLHDATALLLSHQDAAGNVQQFGHDISGLQNASDLVTADGVNIPLLVEIDYDATGRVISQTAGNGVVSRVEYDPSSQRLRRATSQRAGGTLLQDLHYEYDPAGNILSVGDRSQPVRHFANQRTEAVNHYSYDSLYQLITASGREAASAGQGPALPELMLLPDDPGLLLNYTQSMHYDASGNLLELRHVNGQRNRTQRMAVARLSNRALPERDGVLPDETQLAAAFDSNGNLRQLQPGQALGWDNQNQLQQITPVSRPDGDDDYERYIYDAAGGRVRKHSSAQVRNGTRVSDVRYLPGLEIRTDSRSGERLHVVIARAGRSGVRLLHWEQGKPEALSNDQLRYSLDNHLGSCTLELDQQAQLISREEYYPFGGTACWAGRNALEAQYKTIRYSGKERDASGLYYYGLRYYAPWLARWLNPDPGGDIDGLNLYAMVGNNPITLVDGDGRSKTKYDTLEAMIAAGPTPEYMEARGSWDRLSPADLAKAQESFKGHCKDWFTRGRQSRMEVLMAMFDVVKSRSNGVVQGIANMESNLELAKAVGLRLTTIVVSNLSSTVVSTAIGAGIGLAVAGPPGSVIGGGAGFVVGKLASVGSEKGMEKAGNTATLHLQTGSLNMSSVVHDAKIRKNGVLGKAYGKLTGFVPDTPKGALNLGIEVAKTAGSKAAGSAGVAVKIGVDVLKGGYELYKTQKDKDPAKIEVLENGALQTIAELRRRTDQIATMYGATQASDILDFCPSITSTRQMTLGQLWAKRDKAIGRLENAAATASAFKQRHNAQMLGI
ncbi:RHS repeat domain-containing protein [Pseudomonas sp. UBA4194]|uniref:RHS repeat domain-containing protein n=1 Tax=Pseudomonas sp. UBA4194 TaxID=1947317 RepID=UPI0025F2B191|nr:RHS repeat-associated core domain-containing protein [Pseudomonas sp. UBA4194]